MSTSAARADVSIAITTDLQILCGRTSASLYPRAPRRGSSGCRRMTGKAGGCCEGWSGKGLTMNRPWRGPGLAAIVWTLVALAGGARAQGEPPTRGAEVTLQGSMVCNGACVPAPKADDHVMV